jgi:DNA-binding MarR family transcriptional regulator
VYRPEDQSAVATPAHRIAHQQIKPRLEECFASFSSNPKHELVIDPESSFDLAHRFRLSVQKLRRKVRAINAANPLTLSQENVLSTLARDGRLTTADLARREQVRPQSMGYLVIELTRLGFVSKTKDPHDGRREFVELTKSGADALWKFNEESDRDLASLIDAVATDDDRDTLAKSFDILERLIHDQS